MISSWETVDEPRIITAGKVTGYRADNGKAFVTFERGRARLESFGEGILRMTMAAGEFADAESLAVISRPDNRVKLSDHQGVVSVRNGLLTVSFRKDKPFISVIGHDSYPILDMDQAFCRAGKALSVSGRIGETEMFFGLGEKTGFLDKRGRRYIMWNTDDPLHTPDKDPLYKSIPFMIGLDGKRAYGLFVDSTARSEFDLGYGDRERLSITVFDSQLDLYIIDGNSISEVVRQYTMLTGRMEMPPIWSLGFHQSRWGYYPQEKVMELAETFRTRQIPCDAIYLDIDYMDGFRIFTWDSSRFPDPGEMTSQLREQGFRVVTIVDPAIRKDSDYHVYMEGAREGHFCKLPTGEVYHGKVWPGTAAFPDFSRDRTRKWWGLKHSSLFDAGVAGIWNDMNEPSDFTSGTGLEDRIKMTVPDDLMMDFDGKPQPFSRCHNAYGLLMCRATYEGFRALRPRERPFMVTRSAYSGIQRYAAVWTGDNYSWWEHLAASIPMHLNIGLSGIPFVGADVGGFQGNSSPELYARWIQLGAFTPFFRAHSEKSTQDHEPWSFGPEVEEIARKAIRLRYELLPYLYSEFRQACETGLPVMRPLILDFQDDRNVYGINDQFMFGKDIMAAPVTRPGDRKRLVYLPQGVWYDFYTKAGIEGGRFIIADAPLDRIPLFVREGAIIPMARSACSTQSMDFSTLWIEIYAGPEGSFTLYEDDGLSMDYHYGAFNLRRFTQYSPSPRAFRLTLKNLKKGYANGFKKAFATVYGLGSDLRSEDCVYEDQAWRFELDGSDTEVRIG
ncbi:MAG: DUF5110 domain-containing protein [Clostridiaceae bacterium]|nr:DUF5110 domain-containing protein [Clostridiaceae bacterium]